VRPSSLRRGAWFPARAAPPAPTRRGETEVSSSRPRSVRGQSALATICAALGAFLVLLIVLASQLRSHPHGAGLGGQNVRVVLTRRIYETIVHERVIGAKGPSGAMTVSSSSAVSVSPPIAARVRTRTS
jgi:hypothetical protein